MRASLLKGCIQNLTFPLSLLIPGDIAGSVTCFQTGLVYNTCAGGQQDKKARRQDKAKHAGGDVVFFNHGNNCPRLEQPQGLSFNRLEYHESQEADKREYIDY